MADQSSPTRITLLQRRGIEAEVLIPLIRRLERELGRERAHALARETIAEIAREQGRAVHEALQRDDLEGFRQVRDSWGGAGGDLTIEPLRTDAEHLDFNVTRCRFAELYERLGARDLGFLLSCSRDFTLSQGYSGRLHLRRTRTIMEGAPFCDFRYTIDDPAVDQPEPGPAGEPGSAGEPGPNEGGSAEGGSAEGGSAGGGSAGGGGAHPDRPF